MPKDYQPGSPACIDCDGNCLETCRGDCAWSCSGGCEGSCSNTCGKDGCSNSCQRNCTSCTGSCSNTCGKDGCSNSCQRNCTSCTGSCSNTCGKDGCTSSCTSSCTSCTGCTSCTTSCAQGCANTCNNNCSTTCKATCKDKCNATCNGGAQDINYGSILAIKTNDILYATDANVLRDFILYELSRRGKQGSIEEVDQYTPAFGAWWISLKNNIAQILTDNITDDSNEGDIITKEARKEIIDKAIALYEATVPLPLT